MLCQLSCVSYTVVDYLLTLFNFIGRIKFSLTLGNLSKPRLGHKVIVTAKDTQLIDPSVTPLRGFNCPDGESRSLGEWV